jgi:hypothetical protein
MAEPVSTLFQTTLLILYFVTPAVNVPIGETKKDFESTAVWTLQSTSQITLENSDVCSQMGTKLINQFNHVYTVTVRAYCMCPHGDGNKVCFNNQNIIDSFAKDTKKQPTATIIPLGPVEIKTTK